MKTDEVAACGGRMVFLFTAHLTVLKRSAENGNLLVREYTNPHKIFLKFSAKRYGNKKQQGQTRK